MSGLTEQKNRVAGTEESASRLLSPLRGFGIVNKLVLRTSARSYMLSPLRGYSISRWRSAMRRTLFSPAFLLTVAGLVAVPVLIANAEDRKLTPEQLEALAKGGVLRGAEDQRPENLPDLTKGEPTGDMQKWDVWHLGPTGVIGFMVGGSRGDQIQVQSVLKGSPADGKFRWGDVLVGINGRKFAADEHLGMSIGKAIIEAENEANGGVLKLLVWRDSNFFKRNGRRDVVNVDIESLINDAASDNTLYDWKSKDEQKKFQVPGQNYEDFPLDGQYAEVELKLDVLPAYSDTSPYNCPKATRILENAWKVLEQKFTAGKVRGGRHGSVMALALVASGKPEHRNLVREWVRSTNSTWGPPTEPTGAKFEPGYKGYVGYQSWRYGMDGLACAIYYDATGDEFVLPALRKFAVEAAMGQAGGGSWGHTFAYPHFNGGKFHGMNPGYGALNAAGNRCFTLVALAQKLDIKHPEIDDAVERARRFFGSYVDKGGVPYGHHGAAATDDSNGKNVGCAFALKLLGDKHGAQYFAQMSTHASFTRRAGHGNDYFWHYSPWAATLCGPKGTIATHRNLRWRFTLCRRFDGGFVIHSPTGGMQELRDPTGTYALHYSAPFKQTMWTGKDADESMFWTEKGMDHLMTSALPQLNEPSLIKLAGKPYAERTTDEVFKQLDMFKPKARGQYARELGKRYLAGEKAILPRLAELLESDEPRLRDAGCLGLAACGSDATLQYMSKVARLLDDPAEFIRMQAARTMTEASESDETQLALLNALAADEGQYAMSPNSLRGLIQNLFKTETDLATSPFDAGFDSELVRSALEHVIDLDPAGNRPFLATRKGVWSKDTVARVAGPLVFAAEEEQIADQMFSARRTAASSVLKQLGYREYFEATASYLRKQNRLPRHIRGRVTFKRGLIDDDAVKETPAAFHEFLKPMKLWLVDHPNAKIRKKVGEVVVVTKVSDLIAMIESSRPSSSAPSLSTEAQRLFEVSLTAAESMGAKIKLCREELKEPQGRYWFRKLAAMTFLAEFFGPDAIDDIVPYVGHDQWRLREHSQKLVTQIGRNVGAKFVAARFDESNAETACGILEVLRTLKSGPTASVAVTALKHDSPMVRAAAVQTLFAIEGDKSVPQILTFMKQETDPEALGGCELALLSRRDAAHVDRISSEAIGSLSSSEPHLKDSLYWLLGQFGGEKNLNVLLRAADAADDKGFDSIITSLSWSPDPAATPAFLTLVNENARTPRAVIAARAGVRRMLIGPDGIGTLTAKQQLDYAEPILDTVLDESTITFLGGIRTGRSAWLLQKAMRKGATSSAAQSIIDVTSNLKATTPADRKLAVAALIDTIEFIEVTYIRGGVAEAIRKRKEERGAYAIWKGLSAQAGRNLLKLDKPGNAPLSTFNDLDLDF